MSRRRLQNFPIARPSNSHPREVAPVSRRRQRRALPASFELLPLVLRARTHLCIQQASARSESLLRAVPAGRNLRDPGPNRGHPCASAAGNPAAPPPSAPPRQTDCPPRPPALLTIFPARPLFPP